MLQTNIRQLAAMTLVEVLIALAIVAFVFSSLTQMAFDSLHRAKKLELQDKMRNYATEAVQVIYNQKDKSWKDFSTILPPVEQYTFGVSQAQLVYPQQPNEVTHLVSLPVSDCSYVSADMVLRGNTAACEATIPTENGRKKMFGRIITRSDTVPVSSTELPSQASIDIIVACIEGACTPEEYPPFILNLTIYRTGGTQ